MTITAAPPEATQAPRRRRQNPVLRAVKSSLAGRIAFPLVCLAVWLVTIEVVTSIWPFAVDVLPRPSQVFSFMWDEITADTLAPRNMYETFGISLKRLASVLIS